MTLTTRTLLFGTLAAVSVAFTAHAHDRAPVGPPTIDEAVQFIEETEKKLLDLWGYQERLLWVQSTFITHDTELLAAKAQSDVMAYMAEVVPESTRFEGLELSAELARKFELLRRAPSLPAPADPALRDELARIATEMSSMYGRAKYCPDGPDGECFDLGALSTRLAESRVEPDLLDAWVGWRKQSVPMREKYQRYVELGNAGAQELGYADLGALWRSKFDMSPDAFAVETDRLFQQLRPLYVDLHCHVRAKLQEVYGEDIVPSNGPIPAHLLGNMWAQDWGNLFDLLAPEQGETMDLGNVLVERKIDAKEMVRYGERFFTSLGLPALPDTFWKRSMFTKPKDRDVVCHASAWDIDWKDDLRIKMCIQPTEEDFTTIHHELGHNYYQRAYNEQSTLFADSANSGFHEALGDVIALSVTPPYLKKVGLIDTLPPDSLNPLMRRAIEKIAFLPFGLLIDRWRWEVFSGRIGPDEYSAAWWRLRKHYQGVAPPVERTETDFDPGAKFHIAGSYSYTRYFVAAILQFQVHRALCRLIGHQGPLHSCSIYGHKEAGKRLNDMMAMGMSQPWPDALEAVTGEREMDATAIVEYFAPLHDWLKEQNQGRTCGWE